MPATTPPVLWTTPAMLARAVERIEGRREPYTQAWEQTRACAKRAMSEDFAPANVADFRQYFQVGRAHGFATRHLAIASVVTGEPRYARKATDILSGWAEDADGKPSPAAASPYEQGSVLGRVLSVFCDSYAMLYEHVEAEDRVRIEDWLRRAAADIQRSQDVWHEQDDRVTTVLAAQNMGLASIGFVLDDQRLLHRVLRDQDNPYNQQDLMARLILTPASEPDDYRRRVDRTYTSGAPAPQLGEMYDRFVHVQGSGAHFALLSLRFLTLVAEAVHNNGATQAGWEDLYEWTGTEGQSLRHPYDLYADLDFTTDDAGAVNHGYYAGQHVTFRDVPLYELAHCRYPDNDRITSVLRRHRRIVEDLQTFGWTAVLTHGLDDVAEETQ